jgi:hypothetical protein
MDDTDYRIKRFVDDTGELTVTPPEKPGQGKVLDHTDYWNDRPRVDREPRPPGPDPYWGTPIQRTDQDEEQPPGYPFWGAPRPAPPLPPRLSRPTQPPMAPMSPMSPPRSSPVSSRPMSPTPPPISPMPPPMPPPAPPPPRPVRPPANRVPPQPQRPATSSPATTYRSAAADAPTSAPAFESYRRGDTDWRRTAVPDDGPLDPSTDWRRATAPAESPADWRRTTASAEAAADWRRSPEREDWREAAVEQNDWRADSRWNAGGRGAALDDRRPGWDDEDDEDEDEDEEAPRPVNYVTAAVAALVWFIVPMLAYLGYAFMLDDQPPSGCTSAGGTDCLTPRAEALQNLFGNVPLVTITVSVSILIALVLRRFASGWRTVTVGFAAAVVGAGAATVLFTVVSG